MYQSEIFKGLKVVELAGVLAGPSVGMFFAELGAEVIKVENKTTGGDLTRQWKTSKEKEEAPISAYYSSVNFYKKSLFVDLIRMEERNKVLNEIKNADLVIANYKPGSAEKLGMDWESLKNINQRLIYAQINGMSKGDLRPAFDVVLQAETGFISMTGEKRGSYAKMPVAMIDLLAAHQIKEGVLVALYQRQSDGKGRRVEVSLFDSGLASLANQATNWLMSELNPEPMGTMHPNIAPYGEVFTTSDKVDFVLAIGTENQWKTLCRTLGLTDPLMALKNKERVEMREKIFRECTSKIKQLNSKPLFDSLRQENIPYGVIHPLSYVLESQAAQKLIITEEQEGVVKKGIKSVVFKIE